MHSWQGEPVAAARLQKGSVVLLRDYRAPDPAAATRPAELVKFQNSITGREAVAVWLVRFLPDDREESRVVHPGDLTTPARAAVHVACPACSAAPGARCQGDEGAGPLEEPHSARYDAAGVR